MTTVPHPVPSRTVHAIAALFGHEDDTLVAWQRACAQAAAALHPPPDDDRLRQALTLAQDGHVTLEDDGSATVESRGTHYDVPADGACACPDAQHRGATCKHALAVQIHSLPSASLRPGGAHRHAPTAAPTPAADAPRGQGWKPTPKTSAGWDVHEAPASACFKFRVGRLELLYTLRGVSDVELLQRSAATLPTLHDVMGTCEDRAAQRAAAREAAPAAPAAPTAPPAPAAAAGPAPAPPAQPDLQTLVQQALQQVLAQAHERTNGHATPAPSAPTPDDQTTGVCSLHQAPMERRTDAASGESWYSHFCDETQRYCKGAKLPRHNGRRR